MIVKEGLEQTHYQAHRAAIQVRMVDGHENVIVRQMVQSDLPALEWEGEFTHFRRLYADIFESSRNGRAVLWIAELHKQGIIGQLFVQLNSIRLELADGSTRAYIYGFRIKPQYRKFGIGTYMLNLVENDLRRRYFQVITLNVAIDNPGARRLYEKLGYKVIATEPGKWSYRDDQGELRHVNEPAWRMEKKILS